MTIHRRRSIRLKDYDYSQPGSYFVTLCTHGHECLFGDITDGEMVLNDMGIIVHDEILKTESIRDNIEIDKYVIMPNHVHLIVVIYLVGANGGSPQIIDDQLNRAHGCAPLHNSRFSLKPKSIGSFIAGFKSAATKRINIHRTTPSVSVWQRNYYEHIIRDERELNKIRRYVINNPAKWTYDIENYNGLPIDDKQKFWSKFLNEFE